MSKRYYIERDGVCHFELRDYQLRAIADFLAGRVAAAADHGVMPSSDTSSGMQYVDTNGQVWAIRKVSWFSMYNPEYAPPFKSLLVSTLSQYAGKSFVVCSNTDDLDVVEQLVTQRVPVDIGTDRSGSRMAGVAAVFGYSHSAYERMYIETAVLPPNIGVYTFTPVWPDGGCDTTATDVHIFHAIGYAFDSPNQPDVAAHLSDFELRELYGKLFGKILACCLHLKLSHIAIPFIGCGAFSSLRPNVYEKCWRPAFREMLATAKTVSLSVSILGAGGEDQLRTEELKVPFAGSFPKCLEALNTETTLIVNAWDPHSAIGNGNSADNSLDGHIGRCSAATALGTPHCNPALLDRTKWLRVLM